MTMHERISQNMALSFDDALFDIGRPGPNAEWLLGQNIDWQAVEERGRQFQAAYDIQHDRTCHCGEPLDNDFRCRPCELKGHI